jgi:predicted metal-dependent hydrolase
MAGVLKTALLRAAAAPITQDDLAAALGDTALAARIHVRVSTKAARLCLRVDPVAGHVVLVRPARAPVRAVLSFTAARRGWIERHLCMLPVRTPFADGAEVPIGGVMHTVRVRTESRGGVWTEDAQLFVGARPEHTARRVRDWLKARAKTTIATLAREMAAELSRTVTHVAVRDTTSRWGSCNHKGRLSFSWRLILAPEHVLTYVVAHEVAHLKHMNHSAAFWRTVDQLLESRGLKAGLARQWLRRDGVALYRYG